MKKSFTFLLFLFIFTSTIAWCGNIVYPWRSATAIVKGGDTFEVWYNASAGQTVNSIQLLSAYTTVSTSMSIVNGTWTYDVLSGYTYNQKITVTVPSDAPADRYDLVLKTSSGDEISYGGVRVVLDYKENYYIMHISDGHIYQGGYDAQVLLARKSAMIDMANIMDVQILMETGDNMYNVRNNPHRLVEYFQGIPGQNIKGVAAASAAYFLLPGNHDAPIGNTFTNATVVENSRFFNDHWGLQAGSFKYGNGRFMMINNAWNRNEHTFQAHDAVNWLKGDGAGGNFFVSAAHSRTGLHEIIDNYQPLSLVLAGHNHYISGDNPHEFAPGKDKVYIAASIRDHFRFNLFRVDNNTGEYEVVPNRTAVAHVLSRGNINDRSTWELNLTLSYLRNNNGNHADNAATVVNKFNFPILGAKARFVMPKGHVYEIKSGSGTIEQQFDGTDFRIVDVKFDVPAGATRSIAIGASGNTGGGSTATVVISSPNDNESFNTEFPLTVDATHPAGFDWMMLWAEQADEGEQVLSLIEQSPWEFNVSGLSTGTYSFYVRARDNDGGTTDSEKITVTINNEGSGGDSIYVAIASPANNASFPSGTNFKLTVDANHPLGFQWMRLWADKNNEGFAVLYLLNQSPWEFNLTGLSAGTYTFYVRARDYDNGTTDSEQITVTVTDNGSGGATATVVISSPDDNTSFGISTDFKLTVDASHPSGFQWMRLWAEKDNEGWEVLEIIQQSPWEFNLTGLSAGTYSFYVRARDNEGGTTDSEKITVSISVATNINLPPVNILNIYPNPVSNDVLFVEFGLETLSKVSLRILDMNGSLIAQPLSNQPFEPGAQKIEIPLIDTAPGIYIMQISIDGIMQTYKIVVM
jgi:hypothetical protein